MNTFKKMYLVPEEDINNYSNPNDNTTIITQPNKSEVLIKQEGNIMKRMKNTINSSLPTNLKMKLYNQLLQMLLDLRGRSPYIESMNEISDADTITATDGEVMEASAPLDNILKQEENLENVPKTEKTDKASITEEEDKLYNVIDKYFYVNDKNELVERNSKQAIPFSNYREVIDFIRDRKLSTEEDPMSRPSRLPLGVREIVEALKKENVDVNLLPNYFVRQELRKRLEKGPKKQKISQSGSGPKRLLKWSRWKMF